MLTDWAKSLPLWSAWDALAVKISKNFTPTEIANTQKTSLSRGSEKEESDRQI